MGITRRHGSKEGRNLATVIDYRQLNAITIPNSYVLPPLDDLLHSAQRTPFMTTLDLKAGYWQIPVEPKDED